MDMDEDEERKKTSLNVINEIPNEQVLGIDEPPHLGRHRTVSTDASAERGRGRSVSQEHTQVISEKVEQEVPLNIDLGPTRHRLWGLISQHWGWLVIGVSGAAIFGGIFPIWGYVLSNAFDIFYRVDPSSIEDGGARVAIYFVLLAIGCVLSNVAQFGGVGQVGERVSATLRSDLFESFMHRSMAFYDSPENSSGTLTTQLAEDSRIIHKASSEAVAKQFQAFFTLAVGIILGFTASWKIAFVVLATFPLNVIAGAIQMQAVAGQQYDTQGLGKTTSPHAALISTAFTNIRTVNSLSLQFKIQNLYAKQTRILAHEREKRSIIAGIGFGGSNFCMFSTYALLFWYGAQLIVDGEINFRELMTAIMTLMLGAFGLGAAMTDLGDQKEGLIAARRVFESIDVSVMESGSLDGMSTDGIILPSHETIHKIEFVNVSFCYPTRRNVPIFQHLNLVIQEGETFALVGPSGSGKSTIMALLLRFYDPDEGQIFINGIDLKTINIRWIRNQFGYVGQEPKLFSGSILENIKLGRAEPAVTGGTGVGLKIEDFETFVKNHPIGCLGCSAPASGQVVNDPQATSANYAQVSTKDGNEERAISGGDIEMGTEGATATAGVESDIVDACTLSQAHQFITTFPLGYLTDISEGSVNVSGGQKQRLAIARAIVKNPKVMLLDEATSALDATSEKLVQESIDTLNQTKSYTTIVIAHRLSTIKNATKIAVIEHGTVVEIGSHEELLQKEGLYSQLWMRQEDRTGGRGGSSKLLDQKREQSLKVLGNRD
jgi:ABC-type multidrug transport system fused ATPase/permease subunit